MINISSALIVGRVDPLENLLPARVIWINMQYLQYIEQEYLPVATVHVDDFFVPRNVF